MNNSMKNLLFRIVCRITKEPREHSAYDAITASNNDAILICVHELFIEQKRPDRLHQLALTMSVGII